MKNIQIILNDFLGLWRICGALIALEWIFRILTNLPAIFEHKDLQPADIAMGSGPFIVKYQKYCVPFKIEGPQAISGIREMYVRDTYLHGGLLQIVNGDIVVDLGANMGNFTNMALAHGENIHVVAVEPNIESNSVFRRSVSLNKGFSKRVTLIRAFVGQMAEKQEGLINDDPNYKDAPWIPEDKLIEEANLSRIDFLKCDIEGGEYNLLIRNSKLLEMTQLLAVEIHAFAGDVSLFIDNLKANGFLIIQIKWDPDGSCTTLARRK